MCQERTLVMDNIVLLEPLRRDPASLVVKEKAAKSNSRPSVRRKTRVQDPQVPPDFLAVELSSARHMDVWFNPGGGSSDALECVIVAGRELNRKSCARQGIKFQGLCVHIPPEKDEAFKRRMRAETQGGRDSDSAY